VIGCQFYFHVNILKEEQIFANLSSLNIYCSTAWQLVVSLVGKVQSNDLNSREGVCEVPYIKTEGGLSRFVASQEFPIS
jgi:hypothetical protein